MEDAHTAIKLLCKHITEEKKRQCIKESKLLEKNALLQARLDEYETKKKNRRLTPDNSNDSTESDNQEMAIIKLREELEYYKDQTQQLKTRI